MRVSPQTLRLFRVLAAINVFLAFAIGVFRITEHEPVQAVASSFLFGLGFVAVVVALTRDLKAAGTGRTWLSAGIMILVAASVLHLFA